MDSAEESAGRSGTLGDWDREPGEGPGLGAVAAGSAHSPLSKGTFCPTAPQSAHGGRNTSLRASAPAHVPPPLSVVSLSLRLCYLLSFLLFTVNFFVPSASEGDPLGPGLVPAPTGSERVRSISDDISEVRSLSRGREVPTHWLPQPACPDRLGILSSLSVVVRVPACLFVPLHPIAKFSSPSSRSGAGGLRETGS